MTMGSNIAILQKGEMLQFDSPKNIYTKPANEFIAKFIGNPEINVFPAKYNNGRISFINSENICIFALDVKSKLGLQGNEPLKVGIRPEKFLFSRNSADDVELEISFNRKEYLGYESVYYFNIDSHRFLINKKAIKYILKLVMLFYLIKKINI
ncbi:MAG: hypothetical protein B7C24_18070 [Bacteroidetes bacterium 4572_77]|nr:MAG: hypothetical protein B7C24_18070 [Bacteroidetes bacterium 4572_77]